MAIITRTRNGVKYLYESKYIGIIDGKQKHKETCLGKLDENGNLIPSKKKSTKVNEESTSRNHHQDNRDKSNPSGKKNTWDKPYRFLRQNNATNDLNKVAKLNTSRGKLSFWDEQATYQQGNLTIFIPHYEQLLQNASIGKNGEINTPTKKLLDIATMIFTRNNHDPSIKFSLDDYMKLCGLSDRKESRKQVNKALDVLFDMVISYDDSKNKNKSKNYMDMRLVDNKGIKNDIIYLHFAHGFSEMLTDSPVMPYPLAILQASKGQQHRNAFFIARKISEHVYMNAGKLNERRIAIRKLLEAAPYLATEDEVRTGNRNLTDRITIPFLNDLEEACVYLGLTSDGYELRYAGGELIPDNELQALEYETFINAYVWFDTLPDYPSQIKRLETKAEIAEAILTNTKKKRGRKKEKKE